jgi:hypothetical protein
MKAVQQVTTSKGEPYLQMTLFVLITKHIREREGRKEVKDYVGRNLNHLV